jgi:hypothetical protein
MEFSQAGASAEEEEEGEWAGQETSRTDLKALPVVVVAGGRGVWRGRGEAGVRKKGRKSGRSGHEVLRKALKHK